MTMDAKYAPLFEPVTLPNGITFDNRWALNPITTNSSTAEGEVTDEDTAYLRRRAGSAPLQMTTGTYFEDYGQLFEFGPSIVDDAHIEGLKQMAQAMKAKGAKAIIQLAHAGRFARIALKDYGAVYGPSEMTLHTPIEHTVIPMSERKIKHVIKQYGEATRRAILAGFDGVEISNAQRLLPQQFFSPFSNHRKDQYGAQNFENRIRFGVEVMAEVQRVVNEYAPDPKQFIIGFRGTPEETRGSTIGYTAEEFNAYVDELLKVADIQYFATASWGHNIYAQKLRAGKYAGQLMNQVVHDHFEGRLVTIATGGINSPDKALDARQHADMVGMSTAFITEPEFVSKLQTGETPDLSLGGKSLDDLAIPDRAFHNLVEMMDIGESLPKEARDRFRRLSEQTDVQYFKDYQ
ncbi:MAG: NADH-dependent flavin oxidoreductase [Aerococcus sp.]|nr:NADH-dependent flavin oxidoreductase [Aerococcus sp.]